MKVNEISFFSDDNPFHFYDCNAVMFGFQMIQDDVDLFFYVFFGLVFKL